MHIRKKQENGFTIVELLVVITIIGVLATFVGVGYVGYIEQSKKALAETEVQEIYRAFETALYTGLEVSGTNELITTVEQLEKLDEDKTKAAFELISGSTLPEDATMKFESGVLSYYNRGVQVNYTYRGAT